MLSVILCTYNPQRESLSCALGAVARQCLSAEQFELIVVDNNSSPPIDHAEIEALAGRPAHVIFESRQGLAFARAAGIKAASSDLICFFDDDNEIAPDYLENAIKIANAEPNLGAFGGIAEGVWERPIGEGKARFLPFLGVRDFGAEPITASGDRWGPWEPIGAGLCVRGAVAQGFVALVDEADGAYGLGRIGNALLCGEDTLFSRIAHRLGLDAGYRPSLRLRHHIGASRLTARYLARLLEGYGRSHVILESMCGRHIKSTSPALAWVKLAWRFLIRLKGEGLAQAAGMFCWERGYFRQSREKNPTGEALGRITRVRENAP